jgi:hypothetical protein
MGKGYGMKALTLTQPWATLVAIGAKRIETRSWKTSYRGPLAIHAAKGFLQRDVRGFWEDEPFHSALRPGGIWTYPNLMAGSVLAICELVKCLPTVYQPPRGPAVFELYPELDTARERAFGDYSPGRYAWILEDVKQLPEPIPAKGALQLWEFEGVGLWERS